MLSLNSDWLIAVFRKAALAAKKKVYHKVRAKRAVLENYLLKNEIAAASGARRAGEPKARPGASPPRSEINQFLPASRFIRNWRYTCPILPGYLIAESG